MLKPFFIACAALLLFLVPARAQDDVLSATPAATLKAGEGVQIRVPLDTAAVINGSYSIDSAGFVELPILGRLEVNGKTAQDMSTFIGNKLSQYLKDTHVTVTPSIRLTLLGHWQKPGMRYVNPEISIWDACQAAGGPVDEANLLKWKVMRGDREAPINLLNEFAKGTSLRKAGVQSGDIFVIPVPRPNEGFWYWFRESLTATAQIATIATTAMTAYLTYLAVENNNTNGVRTVAP